VSALLEALSATDRRLLPAAPLDYGMFRDAYGSLPRLGVEFLAEVEASGLTGRGGAGFPTARKLATVRAARGRAVVVGNGTEGEPSSWKDAVLLTRNPHLVIDGLLVAARLVGARRVIVAVSRGNPARASLERALAERRDASGITIESLPERFLSGEESALVHWLNGGEAKPTITPPRVFERGVDGRPTLVQNVETLANLALIARHGALRYRETGTTDEPGTTLTTVSGAVAVPGVVEVPLGTSFAELAARCGGLTEPIQAFLTGGYFGRWVAAAPQLRLSRASLQGAGGALGAGAVVALSSRSCGVVETARVAVYMAEQSAGQCGPCFFGLEAVAARLDEIARCAPSSGAALEHLSRLERQISRRGACAHPDGVLGFVASGLRVFRDELDSHLAGRCTAGTHAPVLPVPTLEGGWR
jgi:NADH:ubiquinone oxidoreductase subunit F (NADH-binding)